MGIANLLTLFRLLLIPLFVVTFHLPLQGMRTVAASLFIIAALTDWLDGYLARSLKQISKFGSFLDPVADKLMVATALILLVGESHLPGLSVPAIIIVCREIAISALREWMAEVKKSTQVSVSKAGKIKTALQMLSITLLLLYQPDQSCKEWMLVAYFLLYTAAALSLSSFYTYLKRARKALKELPQRSIIIRDSGESETNIKI